MRKIKFKFWSPVSKEWINEALIEIGQNGEFLHLYCEEFIPCQFTGVLDNNGVEVYEGDIIRKETSHEDFTCAEVKWYSQENDFDWDGWSNDKFEFYNFEIIGNIYENPELLK